MIKIYHNPRCKKSCEGLNYLKIKTKEFEIVNYLEKGLTCVELKDILKKLNKNPYEIIRTQEAYYKTELRGKNLSNDELIEEICKNPKLLQRPIIVSETMAVIGHPVTEIDKIF